MKTVILCAALLFSLAAVAPASRAASNKCVVVKSEKNMMQLECSRDASSFKPGSTVKIKTVKKGAVEGC